MREFGCLIISVSIFSPLPLGNTESNLGETLMLPDFPTLKRKLDDLLCGRIRDVQQIRLGPFMSVPGRILHEGHRLLLEREDGSVDKSPVQKIGSGLSFEHRELENMSLNDVFQRVEKVGIEMADQQIKMLLEKMKQVTSEVGNVVDVGGEKFSMDHFFEMLEKIHLDFDADGKPKIPTIVAGEEGAKLIAKVLNEANEDPIMRQQLEELLERKKEEWLAREISRKLVRSSK